MNEYQIKKSQLINYLNDYISKPFYMKNVFIGIKVKLLNNQKISQKQFNSITKFLVNEKRFKNRFSKEQIETYFQSLIKNQSNNTHTLCEFMVG